MSPWILPRSAWTRHGPIETLGTLDPRIVRGFAVHWPGTTASTLGSHDMHTTIRILENERIQHTSPSATDPTKPWSDIAYQAAADQAGRIWDLRGIEYRSAANGDRVVNSQWGAIILLVGAHEQPTPAMIRAVQRFRTNLWLRRYPDATRVVGHQDLHATACPGPAIQQLVKAGTFRLHPQEETIVFQLFYYVPGDKTAWSVSGGYRRAVDQAEVKGLQSVGAVVKYVPVAADALVWQLPIAVDEQPAAAHATD